MGFEPVFGVDDLGGEGASGKDLRDERIGIESDGCNETLKLVFGEIGVGRLRLAAGRDLVLGLDRGRILVLWRDGAVRHWVLGGPGSAAGVKGGYGASQHGEEDCKPFSMRRNKAPRTSLLRLSEWGEGFSFLGGGMGMRVLRVS
jgi:hypothetical protein